jgi:hypothetical protein
MYLRVYLMVIIKVLKMDDLVKRVSKIEEMIKQIKNIKKIETVTTKNELYDFSDEQLVNWLKVNEVDFENSIKEKLVDTVWDNLNEWEWEYY